MTTSTQPRWIRAAEAAKLIRAQLKLHWPKVKFSVRSKTYSGGSSIRVSWQDGPTVKQVDHIVQPFAGGGFDGSIDMAYSFDHWLMPDGTARIASSPGTERSMGYAPVISNPKPHDDAERVRFAANYISCDRTYSVDFYSRQLRLVCAEYGLPVPEVIAPYGDAYAPEASRIRRPDWGHQDLRDKMHQKLQRTQAAR